MWCEAAAVADLAISRCSRLVEVCSVGTVTRTISMLLLICRETNETMWPVNYSCQTSKENVAESLFLFLSSFVVVVMVLIC